MQRAFFFFLNDPAPPEIYTLSLHDALPILRDSPAKNKILILDCCYSGQAIAAMADAQSAITAALAIRGAIILAATSARSEEHTSELQSRQYLVCRLLLEKKKKNNTMFTSTH